MVEVSIEDTGITWFPSKKLTQIAKKTTETLQAMLSEIEQPRMKLWTNILMVNLKYGDGLI